MEPYSAQETVTVAQQGVTMIHDLLDGYADQAPDALALRFIDTDGFYDDRSATEMRERSLAVAEALSRTTPTGGRVLILLPPGPDYMAAFVACSYASVVAVPAYPLDARSVSSSLERLTAMVTDCDATAVIASAATGLPSEGVEPEFDALNHLDWLDVESVPMRPTTVMPERGATTELAMLQYTSGSTGQPRGVQVTHANLLANLSDMRDVFLGDDVSGGVVTWLPPYHDMGLIGGMLLPLFGRVPCHQMAPTTFLRHPELWLRAISDGGATVSFAPNFGYEYAAQRVSDEAMEGLDLSRWRRAINGAEPVRMESLRRFAERFSSTGFAAQQLAPSYGLAEATLMVTAPPIGRDPLALTVDRQALGGGRVVPTDQAGVEVTACGRTARGTQVRIVDPDTRLSCADDGVGEVWVRGPGVAHGYWGRADESDATFRARLADDEDGSTFLRTGDIGFVYGGDLYLTGRAKDLIVIDGHNVYPPDVEAVLERHHPELRSGYGAVFSVDVDSREEIVVCFEVNKGNLPGIETLPARMRSTMVEHVGLVPAIVQVLPRGTSPRTTSGKIQRRRFKDMHESLQLRSLAVWCSPSLLTEDHAGSAAAYMTGSEDDSLADHEVTSADIFRLLGVAGASADDAAAVLCDPRVATLRALGIDVREPSGTDDANHTDDLDDSVQRVAADVAAVMGLSPEELDLDLPLRDQGMDSRGVTALCDRLGRSFGRPVAPATVFDHPTVRALAGALGAREEASPTGERIEPDARQPRAAAIVGMACKLPGAPDVRSFARMLRQGQSAIATAAESGRAAGWLDDREVGDGRRFGLSVRECASMDPQHWLVLNACYDAVADAGYDPRELAGRRVGVFVGIGSSDHALNQAESGLEPNVYEATGTSHAVCANRVSYLMDLHGPSVAIDTACSSSLVALHTAVQSLRAGECEAVLVAGVNLLGAERTFGALDDGQMLSVDGLAKAFDEQAAGYVRGEGVGAVCLKRAEDARHDGDRVLGLVKGSASAHSGRSNGITAPTAVGQERVIRAALDDAGAVPEDVHLVESHGTGTPMGDPVELTALAQVYGTAERSEPCVVSAVKNHVGHLEAAAGMAGLVATIVALRDGVRPATTGIDQPTTRFDWASSGLRLGLEAEELPLGRPNLAAVSSFGFGGSITHVILAAPPRHEWDETRLVALEGSAGRFTPVAGIPSSPETIPQPTATVEPATERVAVVTRADHVRDVISTLSVEESEGTVLRGRADQQSETVFFFPGQGSVRPGAARELYRTCPLFAQHLDELEIQFRDCGVSTVSQALLNTKFDPEVLASTEVQQPVLVAQQLALSNTLRALGVVPDVVLGHSVGELSAAAQSGALTAAQAVRLAVRRGEAMSRAEAGAMLACRGDEGAITEALRAHPSWTVAAFNGPTNLTVAGPLAEVAIVVDTLTTAGVTVQRLAVDRAFHTEAMNAAAEEVRAAAEQLGQCMTRGTWISTLTGETVDFVDPDYWANQLRSPVAFADAVRALGRRERSTVVEIGASASLLSQFRLMLSRDTATAIASGPNGNRDLLRAVGKLWSNGASIDWGTAGRHKPTAVRRPLPPDNDSDNVPEAIPHDPVPHHAEQGGIRMTTLTDSTTNDPAVIRGAIASVSGFALDEIRATDHLHSDLGLDSLMVSALARKLLPDDEERQVALAERLGEDPSVSMVEEALLSPSATPPQSLSLTAPQAPHVVGGDVGSAPPASPTASHSTRDVSGWEEFQAVRDRFSDAVGSSSSPYERIHDGFNGARISVHGRQVVNFSTFDYLGLSHHPRVRAAATKAIESYGTSAGATPLLYGETPVHRELETAIARMVGTEAAIVFAGGHATNVGTISHLMGAEDLIIHDEWSHDSAVRGAMLSDATRRSFPHNGLDGLDTMLSRFRQKFRRVLICVEGAYSQDGDLPDLAGLTRIAHRHDALLMVDEAHSIGTVGDLGHGVGEAQNVAGTDVDVWMGTLSKGLASLGGYIAGSAELIEYLRYSAPLYLFSTGPSPANAAAALEAIRVIDDEPDRVRALRERADFFRAKATAAGLDIGVSDTSPVVPVIIGDWAVTIDVSNQLLERGFNAMPIGYPAVPRDACRIRFFINAEHTVDELDGAIAALVDCLGLPAPEHPTRALPQVVTLAPRSGHQTDERAVPKKAPIAPSLLVDADDHNSLEPLRVLGGASPMGLAVSRLIRARGLDLMDVDGEDVLNEPGLTVLDCRPHREQDLDSDGGWSWIAPGTRIVRIAWSDALPEELLEGAEDDRRLRIDHRAFGAASARGVDATTLCAPRVFGPGCSRSVGLASTALRSELFSYAPIWDTNSGLVSTGNLAAAALQAVDAPQTIGRSVGIAGPAPLRWGDYLRVLGALTSSALTPTAIEDLSGPEAVSSGQNVHARTVAEAAALFWTDYPQSFAEAITEAAAWWWGRS